MTKYSVALYFTVCALYYNKYIVSSCETGLQNKVGLYMTKQNNTDE